MIAVGADDDFTRAMERLSGDLGGELSNLTRLSGGASQETWSFDAGGAGFIVRRTPGGTAPVSGSQAIGLEAEAAVIRAARAHGVPAPEVLHICEPEDDLGVAYVMRRLRGETIARKILRDDAYATARARLTAQCGNAVARIQSTQIVSLPLLDAAAQLSLYETLLRSFDAPRPVFELAFATLRERLPTQTAPVLVHGDFRLGNLMVDEAGLVAALDWELAHRGDPAEDLGWLCTPSWRFGELNHEVGGFGPLAELIGAYHSAGGDETVTADRVRFWMQLGSLKWGIMCLLMFRAFDSGADHSVERAAIGRRASEAELDLMLMLTERL